MSKEYTFTPAQVPKGPGLSRVTDLHGVPVRGLWRNGNRFYAQFTVTEPDGSKRCTKRALGTFVDVSTAYAAMMSKIATDSKSSPVAEVQEQQTKVRSLTWMIDEFNQWSVTKYGERSHERLCIANRRIRKSSLGREPVDSITRMQMRAYFDDQTKAGRSNHNLNMQLWGIRQAVLWGVDRGYCVDFTEKIKKFSWKVKVNEHVPTTFVDELCEKARTTLTPGQADPFIDFVRLLALCGARLREASEICWKDIDWNNRQLVIGARGNTKNHRSRRVDFNAGLESLLLAMKAKHEAKPEGERTETLFPGYEFAIYCQSVLRPGGFKGFHDLRRFFATWCMEKGVDIQTTARWLGHQDGGLLVAQVYAKVSDQHARAMALRLT